MWGNEMAAPTPGEFAHMFSGKPLPRVRWSSASGISPAFQEHIKEDKQAASDQLYNPTLIMDYRESDTYPEETGFEVEKHFSEERELALREGTVDMDSLANMFPGIMQSRSREEFAARTRNALRESLAHQSMMEVGVMEGIGRAIGSELFNPLGLATFAVPAFNIVQASRFGLTLSKAGNIAIQSGMAQVPLSVARDVQLESMTGQEAAIEIAVATLGGAVLSGAASGIGHAVRRFRKPAGDLDMRDIEDIKAEADADAEIAKEINESAVETPPITPEESIDDKLRGGNTAEGQAQQEAKEITEALGGQLDMGDDLRMPPEPEELARWDEQTPLANDMEVHPDGSLTPDVVETGQGASWRDQLDRLYRLGGGADVIENKLYKYATRHTDTKINFQQWKAGVREGHLSKDLFEARTAGIKRLLQRANNKWRPRDQELTEAPGLNKAHGQWFNRRRDLAGAVQGRVNWNEIDSQAAADVGLTEPVLRAFQGIQRGKQGQEFARIAGDFERSGGRFFISQDPMEGGERIYEITLGSHRARYMENRRSEPWIFESPSGVIAEEAPAQGITDAMKRLTKLNKDFDNQVKVEEKKVVQRAKEEENYAKPDDEAEEAIPTARPKEETRVLPTRVEAQEPDPPIDIDEIEARSSAFDIIDNALERQATMDKLADAEAAKVSRGARARAQALGSDVVTDTDPEALYRPAATIGEDGQPTIRTEDYSPTDTSKLEIDWEDLQLRGDQIDDLTVSAIQRDKEKLYEGAERAQEVREFQFPEAKGATSDKEVMFERRERFINEILGRDVDGITNILKGWTGVYKTKKGQERPWSLMEYFNTVIAPKNEHLGQKWREANEFAIRRATQNKGSELQQFADFNYHVRPLKQADALTYPSGISKQSIERFDKQFPGLKVVYDRSPEGPEKGRLRVLLGNKMIGAAQDTRGGGYSISARSDAYRDDPMSAHSDIVEILRSSKELGVVKGASKSEQAKRANLRRIALYRLTGYDTTAKKHHGTMMQPGYKAAISDRRKLAKMRKEAKEEEFVPLEREDDPTGSVEGDPAAGVEFAAGRLTPEQALKIVDEMPDSAELFGADAAEVKFHIDSVGREINLYFNAPDGTEKSIPVPYEKGQMEQLVHMLNSTTVEPGLKREVIEKVFEAVEKMVCQRV